MKRLLTCLFLVLGLGLTFSLNTNASEEWRKTYTADWDSSFLKSAMKINKKEKVQYSKYDGGWILYWNSLNPKINDLRGDGEVYYVFDSYYDNYYRINEDDKVVSSGKIEYKKKSHIFELTEDNLKFFFKISISSQVIDIKSKFYDYKGYRRYQSVLAEINEQEQIKSSIKN